MTNYLSVGRLQTVSSHLSKLTEDGTSKFLLEALTIEMEELLEDIDIEEGRGSELWHIMSEGVEALEDSDLIAARASIIRLIWKMDLGSF